MTGPSPLWTPQDEQELQRAAQAGLLVESHYLDIKRTLGTTPSDNKECAKDIASFTVDGGLLIYGVDEQQNGPPILTPLPLANFSERIEGIAFTRISEPISLRTTQIPASGGGGLGYLLVHVPMSPRAPHMVDGRYYGRNETTKRFLTDSEVVGMHERRHAAETDVLQTAIEEHAKARPRAHGNPIPMIVVVAEPLGASHELLVPLTDAGEGALGVMHQLAHRAHIPEHQENNFSSLPGVSGFQQRARAVALDNGLFRPDNTFRFYNSEVVFHENGRLVLVAAGPVTALAVSSLMPESDTTKTVVEPVVAGHVDFMVRLAGIVAQDYGYPGAWRMAVVIGDGLDGARSWMQSRAQHGAAGGTYAGDDEYMQTTAATLDELTQHPEYVVNKLIAPLLRSLRSQRRIPWLT